MTIPDNEHSIQMIESKQKHEKKMSIKNENVSKKVKH